MWRPKDWAETRRRHCNEQLKEVGGAECETCPADPQTCSVDYQAGADAMLEAIRSRGFIIGESLRNVKGAVGWANINPKSKWYSIPDDE